MSPESENLVDEFFQTADDMDTSTAQVAAARAALAAHIEALEQDRERLLWLLAQFQMMSPNIDGQNVWVMRDTLRRGPTALAALDAMRAGRL